MKIARAAAVLILLAIAGALVADHLATTTLPMPSGPFAVGRTTDDWIDDASVDPLSPNRDAKRELVVWIWYPAAAAKSSATSDYVSRSIRDALQHERPALISFLTRDVARVRTHGIPDAAVSPRETWPVVILRGGASSEVWNYTTLAEDLASWGYVVVGFDAPYRTGLVVLRDGRVVRRTPENNGELCEETPLAQQDACVSRLLNAWSSDIAFTLDRLKKINETPGRLSGRLDLARIGVMGHSFGGATALQFCHDDARCKAVVDIDGRPFGSVVRDGSRVPTMFLMSDHSRENDAATRMIKSQIESLYDRLPPQARAMVVIPGANHFFFSDDMALLKSHVILGVLRAIHLLKIDGRRQLAVTCDDVHTFFDRYLR